jgi:hypothetical protein
MITDPDSFSYLQETIRFVPAPFATGLQLSISQQLPSSPQRHRAGLSAQREGRSPMRRFSSAHPDAKLKAIWLRFDGAGRRGSAVTLTLRAQFDRSAHLYHQTENLGYCTSRLLFQKPL